MAQHLTALIIFLGIFSSSLSFAETDPKGSVIPSLQTLGEETPLQPELTIEGHSGPIKVEVRRDLNNPEKYFYRPLFYLDIEKFNTELKVCDSADQSFEPKDFFLEFIIPNLSGRLAEAIQAVSQSDEKVRDTDVLGVANLGLEIRFKDIFDNRLIYQDISEDLLPAGPLPTFKLEAVNGLTCGDLYLLKRFLERGAERFEANVFVWSTDNTVSKSIDIEFKSDVLEKIENEIFGSANYSIVFDEDRGGSDRSEESSSSSQSLSNSKTGPSYSAGVSIPIGSFSIGTEAAYTSGSSTTNDSSSSSNSAAYESIKNRLSQTVSGSRILSRDYLTSLGLESLSGFSIDAVNFSAIEAGDQIDLCLQAREQALDYIPVRLDLNDDNKAVLTTREFQEQIGMVNLEPNDIQRLKAAGGLNLDITVLDRTALREAMQCDFTYKDQQSRPTGKWKLTYYPKQVADAWLENQKKAQVDASVEELANSRFSEIVRQIDEVARRLDEHSGLDEIKSLYQILNNDLSRIEESIDKLKSEFQKLEGRVSNMEIDFEEIDKAVINLSMKSRSIFNCVNTLVARDSQLISTSIRNTCRLKAFGTEGVRTCETPRSKFAVREFFYLTFGGRTVKIIGYCGAEEGLLLLSELGNRYFLRK